MNRDNIRTSLRLISHTRSNKQSLISFVWKIQLCTHKLNNFRAVVEKVFRSCTEVKELKTLNYK